MSNIKNFVNSKLEELFPDEPAVPISFRGHRNTVIDADILAKLLGYSTRSKLLADLVPAALRQAIAELPEPLIKEYNAELTRVMEDLSAKSRESQK